MRDTIATKQKNDFSWSTFYSYREEIKKAFPSVYKLKVKKKLFDVVMEELSGSEKILDVGASTRNLGERIMKEHGDVTYKTLDIDRENEHDYYSVDDVDEKFDLIVLAEVIEHLEFMEGIELLRKLRTLLLPGGRVIVTTPNTHHPNIWWSDSDHKTPYRFDVLGGALLWVGFDVEKIYRIYNDQFLRRLVRLHIMAPVHRYLDVDFAKSIVVVASKE
jgi:2-polyprenyl-3-methyl-5-hydroxy-6-metoxy-1,4-benzoquinol methylase